MTRGLFVCVVCVLSLYGSENARHDHLFSLAENLSDENAKIVWYKNARSGDPRGAEYLLKFAGKDSYWMAQLAKMSNFASQASIRDNFANNAESKQLQSHRAKAAYYMATVQVRKRERMYWYEIAAKLNHAKSQFELALLMEQGTQARLGLLKQSAQNAYEPAVRTLSQYYRQVLFDMSKPAGQNKHASQNKQDSEPNTEASLQHTELQETAIYWLEQAAQFDSQSAFELGLLQWQLANAEGALIALSQANILGSKTASAYSEAIQKGRKVSVDEIFVPIGQSTSFPENCSQHLQFIASSLHTKVRAEYIKKRFENDKRFAQLPICIKDVVWLDDSELACQNNDGQRRVTCDLTRLASVKKQPNFTHLVVFADSGRAYVQRGVMYLDRFDAYSVFVHELAHFVGFVDEYALSAQMASVHCVSENAPNLITADVLGELEQTKLEYWEMISDGSVDISESKTCEQFERKSFKPSPNITFLEHHDIEYIPTIYSRMWQKQLAKQKHQVHAAQEFLHLARREARPSFIEFWDSFNTK